MSTTKCQSNFSICWSQFDEVISTFRHSETPTHSHFIYHIVGCWSGKMGKLTWVFTKIYLMKSKQSQSLGWQTTDGSQISPNVRTKRSGDTKTEGTILCESMKSDWVNIRNCSLCKQEQTQTQIQMWSSNFAMTKLQNFSKRDKISKSVSQCDSICVYFAVTQLDYF